MTDDKKAPLWRIKRFAGPNGLGLQGLGPATIGALYDAGIVTDIPDIYDLPYNTMRVSAIQVKGRRIGADGAIAIAKAVTAAKAWGCGLTCLLHALVPHVSWKACESVAVKAKDLKAACRLTEYDLVQCHGMGWPTASRMLEYLSSDEAKELAKNLEKKGVDTSSPVYIDPERMDIL